MASKNNVNDYNFSNLDTNGVDYRDSIKHSLSKNDLELFDETKNTPSTVVRVKRMGTVDKNERWRIIVDEELKYILEAAKLSKKECAFLRTAEGVNFVITEYKAGFKSVNELRSRLKKKI